jgi:hypothetical protein
LRHQPLPHQSLLHQSLLHQPLPHQPLPHQPLPHQPSMLITRKDCTIIHIKQKENYKKIPTVFCIIKE